jgi:DNA-binding MarR family transcriptional regulator
MTTDFKPRSLPKNHLRLWLKLLKATTLVENQLRAQLRDQFGTTLPRFDVMAALHRHPDGLLMSKLSQVLRVSSGNVTGLVDRLVQDGMVERQAEFSDRRAFRVRLSEAGAAHFAVQAAAHLGWVDALLAPLDPQHTQVLLTQLDAISNHIDHLRKGKP